jgi:hypothetical protein
VHLYNFSGGSSAFWSSVGFSGSTPWKALLDRDGYIRKNGSTFAQFDTTIKECLGMS